MRRPSLRIAAGLIALGAATGLAAAMATPAGAATVTAGRPAVAAARMAPADDGCPGTEPKLDYYYYTSDAAGWTNVCGTGTWDFYGGIDILTIRMPTTPYHRVWFHENADNSGWAECYYSEDTDIYIPPAYQYPGNIQVSDNTSPC